MEGLTNFKLWYYKLKRIRSKEYLNQFNSMSLRQKIIFKRELNNDDNF